MTSGIMEGLNPIWKYVGVALALVVLALFGAMSILGANNSANLASGTSYISQFLPIFGIVISVGLISMFLKSAK